MKFQSVEHVTNRLKFYILDCEKDVVINNFYFSMKGNSITQLQW